MSLCTFIVEFEGNELVVMCCCHSKWSNQVFANQLVRGALSLPNLAVLACELKKTLIQKGRFWCRVSSSEENN